MRNLKKFDLNWWALPTLRVGRWELCWQFTGRCRARVGRSCFLFRVSESFCDKTDSFSNHHAEKAIFYNLQSKTRALLLGTLLFSSFLVNINKSYFVKTKIMMLIHESSQSRWKNVLQAWNWVCALGHHDTEVCVTHQVVSFYRVVLRFSQFLQKINNHSFSILYYLSFCWIPFE